MVRELKINVEGVLDLYFLHAMITFERINIENEINLFAGHDKDRVVQLLKDLEYQIEDQINKASIWWVNKDDRKRK